MDGGSHYRERDWRREQAHREAVRHPVTDEPMGLGEFDRSLDVVLANPQEQDLFLNVFLFTKDPVQAEEIGQIRSNDQRLSEEQQSFLNRSVREFNHRRAEMAEISRYLTEEELGRVAHLDERVAGLVTNLGGRAPAFMLERLQQLALTNHAQFQRVGQALKAVHEIRDGEEMKRSNEKTLRILEKYQITEDQYKDAVAAGNTFETHKKLTSLVRAQMTGLETAAHYATFGFLAKFRGRQLVKRLEERDYMLDEADSHLKNIARVLHGTLDDRTRLEMQNLTWNGERGPELEYNVTTLAQFKNARTEIDDLFRMIQDRFKTYAGEEAAKLGETTDTTTTQPRGGGAAKTTRKKRRKNWSDLTAAEKSRIRVKFTAEEDKKYKSYKGRGVMDMLLNRTRRNKTFGDIAAKVASI